METQAINTGIFSIFGAGFLASRVCVVINDDTMTIIFSRVSQGKPSLATVSGWWFLSQIMMASFQSQMSIDQSPGYLLYIGGLNYPV